VSVPRIIAQASVPQLLLAASIVSYGVFFVLLSVFGQPGLGLGEGFNVPVVLAALVTGPVGGALAGLCAVALFELGLMDDGRIHAGGIFTTGTEIRLIGYVMVGLVVGYFATRGRRLLADALHMLDDLLALAGRDLTTATLASPGLERAMSNRLAGHEPFVLLVVEALSKPADGRGVRRLLRHVDEIRRIASAIGAELHREAELARIGPTRFAVLVPAESSDDAREAILACERALDEAGFEASVGWAEFPDEGRDTFSLFSVAVERLCADLLVRGEWKPAAAEPSFADAVATAASAVGR
jgi:hypothetical protein